MNKSVELTCSHRQGAGALSKAWIRACFCVVTASVLPLWASAQSAPASLAEMRQKVAAAGMHGQAWDGPQSGPVGASGKLVAIISDDLRNGGIYFDFAVPELIKAGQAGRKISLLSAGDGSSGAFMRIQSKTFQNATVAEPLNLHGWQLVDELNRLIMHQPVSGYVPSVHLVTSDNIAFDGGPHLRYDPDNGYRDVYRRIWQR